MIIVLMPFRKKRNIVTDGKEGLILFLQNRESAIYELIEMQFSIRSKTIWFVAADKFVISFCQVLNIKWINQETKNSRTKPNTLEPNTVE